MTGQGKKGEAERFKSCVNPSRLLIPGDNGLAGMWRGSGPIGRPLQYVPAQILVLHDVGKLLAHVGGVHLDGLLL